MEEKVWIYFSKTGTGYEMKGTDIISGIDAFLNTNGTYLVEYSHSDILGKLHFFIYEWDNSQKKRRTVFEGYQRELVLMGLVKNVNIPDNIKQAIISIYFDDSAELELEKKMQTREQKLKLLNKTIETLWHGVSDTKEGDYPKIINLYKEVLKINSKDRDAWENMVWLMWSMAINKKDTAWLFEAEKFVKMYLSINPNGYRAYEYLGQFYRVMMVDERLATRYYESALRWKDAPETTFHSLTSLYVKNGDKVRAIGNCRFNLKRYPNDPYAKSKLKELTK